MEFTLYGLTIKLSEIVVTGVIIYVLALAIFDYASYSYIDKGENYSGKFMYHSVIDEIFIITCLLSLAFLMLISVDIYVHWATYILAIIAHLVFTSKPMYSRLKRLSPVAVTAIFCSLLYLDSLGVITTVVKYVINSTY